MCDFMENKKAVAVENAAEDTIDLLEIFRALYRRWVWIVFAALVFGIALGMYGKFVVKDVFQAEASMCIIDSNKEVSISDLQIGSALTNDYEGIIKSRVVLTKVISNLNLNIAYKSLYNAVSVDNPEATRIIRIRVVSGNKEEAVDIANEILSVSIEEIPHVLGSNTPTVLDKADEFFAENTRRSVVSYILIGLMAGIVVSCGVIAISVITNTSIKNEEDIQKCSGLSVLGTIPDYKGGKKRKEKIIWPDELPFSAAEAIYQLRTAILYSSKDVKMIAVTSAFENQGKSFISFHLAYSLSQVGKRVLLVDTDMRKSVLQSGKLVTNASALLSAKWLRTLCDSVKDSYDYIIFDTPPVGVVGDAAIVSSVCDGTLLVIENGVTKKKTLCQIAAELEKIDTNILGVVQNMVGSKKDSSYYGKGNYGYYYGNNQNKK